MGKLVYSFKQTLLRIKDAEISLLSSSMAFTTMISFIPWLAVSLSVLRINGDTEKILKVVEPILINYFLPGSQNQIAQLLALAIERIHSGVVGFAGFFGLILTSLKLFFDLDQAVHRVWLSPSKRTFVIRTVIYSVLMFLGPLIVAITIGVLGRQGLNILKNLPNGTVGYVFLVTSIFILLRWGPSHTASFKASIISTLSVVFGLVALESSYIWLFKKFFKYGKVYGSLAAVPMSLIWLQIMWFIILTGVAFTAVLDEQNKQQS